MSTSSLQNWRHSLSRKYKGMQFLLTFMATVTINLITIIGRVQNPYQQLRPATRSLHASSPCIPTAAVTAMCHRHRYPSSPLTGCCCQCCTSTRESRWLSAGSTITTSNSTRSNQKRRGKGLQYTAALEKYESQGLLVQQRAQAIPESEIITVATTCFTWFMQDRHEATTVAGKVNMSVSEKIQKIPTNYHSKTEHQRPSDPNRNH